MMHIDPSQSVDTMPKLKLEDVDTLLEATNAWVVVEYDHQIARVELVTLAAVLKELAKTPNKKVAAQKKTAG